MLEYQYDACKHCEENRGETQSKVLYKKSKPHKKRKRAYDKHLLSESKRQQRHNREWLHLILRREEGQSILKHLCFVETSKFRHEGLPDEWQAKYAVFRCTLLLNVTCTSSYRQQSEHTDGVIRGVITLFLWWNLSIITIMSGSRPLILNNSLH